MESFVTVFNTLYIPQGLALYRSMERHIDNYELWIICVDDECHNVLNKMNLSNVKLIKLSSVETKDLLRVKKDRSMSEYCWTLTPFSHRFVFEADQTINRVTYLDADMWFLKSPIDIFNKFNISKKNVLITEHAYAPEYDQTHLSGKYCVQFLTFTRNGEHIRKWWEEKCIEWCYAIHDNGRFGDQKYLDDWDLRFAKDVFIFPYLSYFQAPWNASIFDHSEAYLYHFHQTKIKITMSKFDRLLKIGSYDIPPIVINKIYNMYIKDIRESIKNLSKYMETINSQHNKTDLIRDRLAPIIIIIKKITIFFSSKR